MSRKLFKRFGVSLHVDVLIVVSLAACLVIAFTAASSKASGSMVRAGKAQATMVQVDPATYQRTTIYSSHPQKCGDGTDNCRSSEWTGTWFMPDGSLVVAFNQATGPTSAALGRTFTPEKLLNEFKFADGRIWTHVYPAPKGYWHWDKGYDYFGLSGDCPASPKLPTTQKCSLIVYLKSTDAGQTWTTWRTEPFQAIGMSAYTPLSNEENVKKETPPTFLIHGVSDSKVPVENSLLFVAALREAGVPFELHFYEHGEHGFALGGKDAALSTWPEHCAKWLRLHKFIA